MTDDQHTRRALLQAGSVAAVASLAGCTIQFAGHEISVGEDDAQTTTKVGYGGTTTTEATTTGTDTGTATTTQTTSGTTTTGGTTATTTSTTTTGGTTATTTSTTTTATTTTSGSGTEDEYGIQGYGEYGYGGVAQ